jgi:hypothetical protein
MPKKLYSIRIEPTLLEKIQQKAKEDRRSVNQSIEIAIEEYCKASGR